MWLQQDRSAIGPLTLDTHEVAAAGRVVEVPLDCPFGEAVFLGLPGPVRGWSAARGAAGSRDLAAGISRA